MRSARRSRRRRSRDGCTWSRAPRGPRRRWCRARSRIAPSRGASCSRPAPWAPRAPPLARTSRHAAPRTPKPDRDRGGRARVRRAGEAARGRTRARRHQRTCLPRGRFRSPRARTSGASSSTHLRPEGDSSCGKIFRAGEHLLILRDRVFSPRRMAGLNVDLSVVLPVYNGASFVASSVSALAEFLSRQRLSWEIVLVDDGSTDGTASLVPADSRVTVVRLATNRGKFAAVKAGMAAATGRCRVFTDADVPYDLEALPYVESLVNTRGFHVIVGDRALTESIYGKRLTRSRAAASRGFSFLVRMLVTGGLFDTQCGLKGFRGDVADALFPLLTVEGFAGDVELLYVALKYNLEIRRIPVRLRKSESSTVRFGTHAPGMLREVLRLRRKWVRGLYESEALRRLAAQDYWASDS